MVQRRLSGNAHHCVLSGCMNIWMLRQLAWRWRWNCRCLLVLGTTSVGDAANLDVVSKCCQLELQCCGRGACGLFVLCVGGGNTQVEDSHTFHQASSSFIHVHMVYNSS